MNIARITNPQFLFIIIGLIYGIAFLAVIPPLQIPDEYEHFYKAYDISNGNIIPEKIGDKAGIYVPKSVKIATDNVYQEWEFFIRNNEKLDMNYLLNLPFRNDDRIFVDISKFAVITYSPIPYLAAALGIAIGKIFNLSPLMLIYMGRLANLMLWLILIYLAIRITPIFKHGFLAISLMPMTLFQAASFSVDSLTIALSFLTIAIFLKLAFDENKKKIDRKDILILLLIIIPLGLTKLPYFLLIFLFFLIPTSKFRNRKNKLLIFSTLLIITLLIIGIWNFMVKGLYMPINPGISIKDQFIFVLLHPFEFIQIISNTFYTYGASLPILHVGNWSFNDTPLPEWIFSTYLLALLLVALFDKNTIKIKFKQRSIIFATIILTLGSLLFLEYITWTAVGAKVIEGLQGRYFIPILPIILLLFYNNRINIKEKIRNLIIIAYVLLILSITIFTFINVYY